MIDVGAGEIAGAGDVTPAVVYAGADVAQDCLAGLQKVCGLGHADLCYIIEALAGRVAGLKVRHRGIHLADSDVFPAHAAQPYGGGWRADAIGIDEQGAGVLHDHVDLGGLDQLAAGDVAGGAEVAGGVFLFAADVEGIAGAGRGLPLADLFWLEDRDLPVCTKSFGDLTRSGAAFLSRFGQFALAAGFRLQSGKAPGRRAVFQ